MDLLAKQIYRPPNLGAHEAVRHGRMHEGSAVEKFKETTGKNIKDCGLFVLPELPYLGATPDGIVVGENAIIEVKCPYTKRHEKIVPGEGFSFLEIVNDKVQLKRNHDYHYQVQGQMKISGYKFCYFIVFTFKDLHYEVIEFDEAFFEDKMRPKLASFYDNVYCPFIADEIAPGAKDTGAKDTGAKVQDARCKMRRYFDTLS